MSVPLDRLYHYIESITEEIRGGSVIIYHFFPHGSKNINDIQSLHADGKAKWKYSPRMVCHDQEPLNFDLYTPYKGNLRPRSSQCRKLDDPATSYPQNLWGYDLYPNSGSIFGNKLLLLHSEKNSMEIKKYLDDGFIPVYYWSHALIALDWFRFAQHVTQNKNIKKRFLIYNRAWSGTREYRLKFADHVIKLNLENNCLMRVSPVDSTIDKHYKLHDFKNSAWRPDNIIEDYFPLCEAESHYSADFDLEDYESTDIEVVLETLFDDQRLHLTEKTLRPIALGQPFILAGPAGSLDYLRSYGFKTFDQVWSEGYDLITDPAERLMAITNLMHEISNWTPAFKEQKIAQAQAIADYNRQYFFSNDFFNQITNELKENLSTGIVELNNTII